MPSRVTETDEAGLPPAPLLSEMSLRGYQREAITMIRRYLVAHRAKKTTRAALVQMATGTGKSGIIAAVSRCLPMDEVGCVLVLAPRVALRHQLFLDINGRFFERLKKSPSGPLPKTIVELKGEPPALSSRSLRGYVFVATIQMLESLKRAAQNGDGPRAYFYGQLMRNTKLLIVDEGHYEPATSWGESIREFACPKALFTATPYRNDFKPFDVDFEYWSCYTYDQARERRYLRDVRFVRRQPTANEDQFIGDVVAYYAEHMSDTDARVIIRCDDEANVERMGVALRNRGLSVVAIHENFASPRYDWQRRTVPDLARKKDGHYFTSDGPIFWIHQFKLLEGIDHSQFRLLALFGAPLRNSRSLVQQVGRVVRNPPPHRPQEAIVLDHSGGKYESRWARFLEYDRELRSYSSTKARKALRSAAAADNPVLGLDREGFVKSIMDAHPLFSYFDRDFRRRLDPTVLADLEPEIEFQLPLTANFFGKKPDFALSQFMTDVADTLRAEDLVVYAYEPEDESTGVLAYFALSNADFLTTTYLLVCQPGLVVVHELDELVSVYDSGGRVPYLQREQLARPPAARSLSKVLRRNSESTVRRLDLKNANLGNRAIRRRSVVAASMQQTVPALDDYGHVVSSLVGVDVEIGRPAGDAPGMPRGSFRRYVGFAKGRLSQAGPRRHLPDYVAWVRNMAAMMNGQGEPLDVFGRYAREIDDVADTDPANILIDVFDVEHGYETVENPGRGVAGGQLMDIEDVCYSVNTERSRGGRGRSPRVTFGFELRANGQDTLVSIVYDGTRRRYTLRSSGLDAMYRPMGNNPNLLQYLNDEQSFRVLPNTPDVVYMDGGFYSIDLPGLDQLGTGDYHVGRILHPSPTLKEFTSEKGAVCVPDGSNWDRESLFGIIARRGKGYDGSDALTEEFGAPDILVCDDLDNELADFIMADRKLQRVVFIHAKGVPVLGKKSLYSASKLADVCSQAVKNIHYLSMFNERRPENLAKWTTAWTANGVRGTVKKRIVKGSDDPKELWRELWSRISNPRTNREVWLFLGGRLSKSAFNEALGKRVPEAVQGLMQLQSTMSAVGSIDAKLRVFCSP